MVVLNDGTSTRFTPVNNQPSPLDLCITTPGLALGAAWSVWDDCANSDHYPTLVVVNQGKTSLDSTDFTHFNLFNTRKADWSKYQSSLSLSLALHGNQNLSYEQFNQYILAASSEAIPKKTFNYTGKLGNPWWDDTCSLMVKKRRNKLIQFKLHPTSENFLEAKRQIAITNRHLRKTKKAKFRQFCESLNRNSNISQVWKIIKKFDNKNIRGQKQVLTNEEVASQILAELTVNNIPTTLTPILFNIYLSSIYDNIPSSHKLLGYADDLVLICRGNNISDMVKKTNDILAQINEWTISHDLILSKEKCKAMIISRGKQPSAPPIIINNRAINYIENYKYLGVTINQNLKWNQQISTMVNKANQGLNIIKTFCRTSWGADPKTMQIAVNALVRSHLDYGSFLILPTSIKNISKLNTGFHASLRVVSGCMKSTPIEALLAENSVMDLHHRRIWLSAKVITKNISYINHPLIEEIKTLSHSCSNNSYWRNKNTPYLTGYFTQLHVAKVINLNIKKNDSADRYKFLEYTDKYKNSHNFIYTDASKIKHRVGCAVHIPGKSINLTTRLPDHMDL
nr:unnamed protein product [Callosobruchus analis]